MGDPVSARIDLGREPGELVAVPGSEHDATAVAQHADRHRVSEPGSDAGHHDGLVLEHRRMLAQPRRVV